MSSSSLNCEKVEIDTYIINSNYEKINPSVANEQNETPLISERSKSLLSSITSPIENDGQEGINNKRMPNHDDEKYIDINDDNHPKQIKIKNYTELPSYPNYDESQYSSNSHDSFNQSDHHMDVITSSNDDLTKANQLLSSTFYSKDSALGLSDDHINILQSNDSTNTDYNENNKQHEKQKLSPSITSEDEIADNNEIEVGSNNNNITIEKMQKNDTTIDINDERQFNEHEKNADRTISSSSSEQLIPKEKQTGMYYNAFGSSASLHLTEQYCKEWLQDIPESMTTEKPIETDNNHVRIVHQSQIIGDNEDEFYYSPQTIHSCSSCPNFNNNTSKTVVRSRSYSLTTLDAYTHLNITNEILEQIWQSLLNVAFSDKDEQELNEYRLRHFFGLSNSNSAMNQSSVEKSRSHNDIYSIMPKNDKTSSSINKSKSFDITPLLNKSSSANNGSANLGLLEGADISEPFADRVISLSVHSDLESIHSSEHETIPNEKPTTLPLPPPPPPPAEKEPLDYVFDFQNKNNTEEFDLEPTNEMDDKSIQIAVTFEENSDEDMLPMMQVHDVYTELSLFRPHSLSTIPSSRGSQYASSVDSDDLFDREHQTNKDLNMENSDDNFQYHPSDDDRGVIGSEFSSPQSRPLSSIQSQPLSPEGNQKLKKVNFSDIDHDAWERCIDEPMCYDALSLQYHNEQDLMSTNQYSNNFSAIIPVESFDSKTRYLMDEIEPISSFDALNQKHVDSNTFIEEIHQSANHQVINQDYLTIETQLDNYLDPNELTHRLEQLDLPNTNSNDEQNETNNSHYDNHHTEDTLKLNVENLTSIVNEIHRHSFMNKRLLEQCQPVSLPKPANAQPMVYQNQRIDKVSDLEIVKQGNGFKIGYTDRHGTDQRVILTKKIEAGPDILQRDPNVRVPSKERRRLNQVFSSVLFTNGSHVLLEDKKFEHTADAIDVPTIGTNPKHFDESDMVSIDIDGPSTMLSSICESLVITQGSVYSNTPTKNQSDRTNAEARSDLSSNHISSQYEEYLIQTSHLLNKDRVEVLDSWHNHTIINGSSNPWRLPFKPIKPTQPTINSLQLNNSSMSSVESKPSDINPEQKSTRDVPLSPISFQPQKNYRTISTSPINVFHTVDQSSQYSPPMQQSQKSQYHGDTKSSCTQVSSHDIPGFLQTHDGIQTYDQFHNENISTQTTTLERSADSGILVDEHHRMKSNLALQVDMKSSSSDSEDISEVNTRPILRQTPLYNNSTPARANLSTTTNDIEQQILQLRRERTHILDLLSLNWSRSNIWVELTEAKLNYIIGETDALLRSLSYDSSSIDNETVKLRMHQYEEDMTALTRQHLAVYRERLEDSKRQLDMKIDELESRRSSIEIQSSNRFSPYEQIPRSIHNKRLTSFLSTSAENLTRTSMHDTVSSHPQLLDVSFLASNSSRINDRETSLADNEDNRHDRIQTNYRTTKFCPRSINHQYDYSTRINNGNLSHMEGLSKSQQAILDETDKLVKDSQQLHTESASQFERARESLLSSETSIRLARANMDATRLKPYLEKHNAISNNVTLAELFKYEQLLTKETTRNHQHIFKNNH